MDRTEAKMIIAYAQSNMKTADAALKVYYSWNTVDRCFKRIKEKTGLDPRNFFDLIELYSIARNVLGDDFELL